MTTSPDERLLNPDTSMGAVTLRVGRTPGGRSSRPAGGCASIILARVDVRAELVPGNAGCGFNGQDALFAAQDRAAGQREQSDDGERTKTEGAHGFHFGSNSLGASRPSR